MTARENEKAPSVCGRPLRCSGCSRLTTGEFLTLCDEQNADSLPGASRVAILLVPPQPSRLFKAGIAEDSAESLV